MLPVIRTIQNDCTHIQPKRPRLPCLKRMYMEGWRKMAKKTSWAIGTPDIVPDIVTRWYGDAVTKFRWR